MRAHPTSASLPSLRPLLVFAVLLPATVAGLNQLLLELAAPQLVQIYFLPSMAVSIAILSWFAGRCLQPSWIGVLVFAWSLALLDLLTFAACRSGPIDDHFAFILVSAQVSIIVLWAILGSTNWQWRLPVILAAAPIVIALAGAFAGHRSSWPTLMGLTAAVVGILCGSLRAAGFLLRPSQKTSTIARDDRSMAVYQFGLRHMLIWATAIVPLLLVARALDLLMFADLDLQTVFPAVLLSLCFATVNLIAIWAALGSGLWPVRVAALFFVPFCTGTGLNHYSALLKSQYGRWNGPPLIDTLVDMNGYWLNWLCVNAALLAALLLFLRANGYRLSRLPR